MQVSFIVHCIVPNRLLPCGCHPTPMGSRT